LDASTNGDAFFLLCGDPCAATERTFRITGPTSTSSDKIETG
jgi:hypothetical protein